MTTTSKLRAHRWIMLPMLSGLGLGVASCIGHSGVATNVEGTDVSASGAVVIPSEPASSPIVGDTGDAKPAQVFVSFDRRFQVLEGFGASVAWYIDRIVGDTPAGMYEML